MRLTRRVLAEIGFASAGLTLSGLGLAPGALAQPQPVAPVAEDEPVLRIETGAHVARTGDSAVDAAQRLLVTASDDKTARLWSLPDLRALAVLRPPLGPDRDGSIHAVAMTPDCRLAALGGWFGTAGRDGVLVFDLQSHQVVRHLAGMTSTVNRLAISADGSRLVAGGGDRGLVAWRLADGALLWRDSDYAGGVNGLAFAADGHLAATAADGALRLYDAAGHRLQKLVTTAGRNPAGVAFAPNGRHLAVSYWDAPVLEARDAASLSVQRLPDLANAGFTGTTAVGWSADGDTLFAGGRSDALDAPPLRPVYAWGSQGSGPRQLVFPGYGNAAGGLQPLAGGRLAYNSLSGDIAVLDGRGGILAERPGGAGNLRRAAGDNASQLMPLSADGRSVAWVFLPTQGRWHRFDSATAELVLGEPPAEGMTRAVREVPGLAVTDWAAGLAPKVNGRTVALAPGERSQAAAVGNGRALLGTGWNLRLFRPDATEVWHKPLQSQALRVNLSTNGRLAVCAQADGTIRWYRATDGTELLALFVTPDASRWVAWTPGSFYAAGPGGEDLIGWHVNRGPARAGDFFPGSRFRDQFYRPDVVRLVLATLDEAEALGQANARRAAPARENPGAPARDVARPAPLPVALVADLPAIATILDPAEDAELPAGPAAISISLRSPSGAAVTQVVPLLDGSPAVGASALSPLPTPPEAAARGEQHYRFTLPLPPGRTSLLAVRADTATREGLVATRRLRAAAGPAAPALGGAAAGPRLNALLVGVSDYANPSYRTGVGFAAKDALDLAEVLRAQAQRSLFRDQVQVRTLTNGQATRGAVLESLRALRGATRPDDVTIVSFAGHGVLDEGATHFMPQDGDVEHLASTAVDPAQLGGLVAALHGRVLVLFDICHAGNALFAAQRLPDMSGLVNQMRKPGAGVMVLAATPASETAIEVPGGQNGAFTDAVLRGLRGGAQPDAEGLVYTDQLIAYSKRWMRQAYRRNPISYPLDPNLPDFPLLSVQ